MTTEAAPSKQNLYRFIAQGAQEAQVFGAVTVEDQGVSCRAKDAAEEAFYWVRLCDDELWISLETIDRWLSGSIESDLVNTGDKIDELIEEEVVDLGHDEAKVKVDHFRSPEKIYVFRAKLSTPVSDSQAGEHALIWLLGFELVFRELGDMDESGEE